MALLETGDTIDGFEIRRQVGEGGFGEVFEALELVTGRRVALKLVKKDRRTGAYDPTLRARFEREARAVATLKSPHVVRLYSAGELSNGLLYGAFEYVEGEDLSEFLARGLPAVDVVVDLLEQLLRALEEANRAGLIHRDIKPQNIRVQEQSDGSVTAKLLDFGIVRASDDGHPALTETGELIGTPRYMSPEQLSGKPLSAASDIYSLGMVAFEALVGSDALPGGALGAQIDRLRTGHVFSAPALQRIGPELIEIVQRMTARRAEDRYASASAVLHALERRGSAGPVVEMAQRPEPPKRARLMIVGGLLIAALVVGALVVWNSETEPTAVVPPPAPRSVDQILKQPHPAVAVDVGNAPASVDPFDTSVATGDLTVPDCDLSTDWHDVRWAGLDVDVYVPHSYDRQRRPAMIAMFRRGGKITPRRFVEGTGMIEVAEAHQVVLVAPDSKPGAGLGSFLGSWMEDVIEDAWSAVTELQERLCTDPARLFLLGSGRGAAAVDRLWAAHGEKIAAVATTGHRYERGQAPPNPRNARPYLHFAQLDSPREPVEGGAACNDKVVWSLEEQRVHQKEVHGCSDEAVTEDYEDGRCRTFDCPVPLVGCDVEGGLNWTPGAPATGDVHCEDGPVSQFPYQHVVWEFFAAHPRAD